MNVKHRAILARIKRIYADQDAALFNVRVRTLTESQRDIYETWVRSWSEWEKAYDTDADAYAALINGDLHNPEPNDLPNDIAIKLWGYDPAIYRVTEADTAETAQKKWEAFKDEESHLRSIP